MCAKKKIYIPKVEYQTPQDIDVSYNKINTGAGGGGSDELGDLAYVNFPELKNGNVLNDYGNWVPMIGGGGGEIPVPEIPWEEIEELVENTVDTEMGKIIDLIEDGEISVTDVNYLRTIKKEIDADHVVITKMITDYQLPSSLSTPYNSSYNALLLYLAPYLDGSKTIVDDVLEFETKFRDYYEAKAAIEAEVTQRVYQNGIQAKATKEFIDGVNNFWNVQINPEAGVIISGTMLVGTPSYNNGGMTGVTDQGSQSVRIWAGTNYANRYNANFRVLDNGNIWVGSSNSGFDFGITSANTFTLRGILIQDLGGNTSGVGVFRGPYGPGIVYNKDNQVTHNGSVWIWANDISGNSGAPSPDNPDWEIYVSGGVSAYTSRVYKRSTTVPATPVGGSFESPLPDPLDGWSDNPPAGSETLYESTRIFTKDGNAPQQPSWKTPVEANSAFDMNIQWSLLETEDPNEVGTPETKPLNWGFNSELAVWKAEQKIVNGIEKEWNIFRIKGEKGEPGEDGAPGLPGAPGEPGADGLRVEYRYKVNGSYTVPPEFEDDIRIPTGWELDAPSSYNPENLDILWRIEAYIRMSDDELETVWHNPIIQTGIRGPKGEDGVDGRDGIDGVDGDGARMYMSVVHRRSTTDIANSANRPTGGNIDSPIPTGGLWWKGIPPGSPDSSIFVSRRLFSDNPSYQEPEWSIPELLVDSPVVQYRYATVEYPSPATPPNNLVGPWGSWKTQSEIGSGELIWHMATRTKSGSISGTFNNWVVARLHGKDGANGTNGVNPPMINNRDLYEPGATYIGNSSLVEFVIYDDKGYVTTNTAGTFANIPPTGHAQSGAKWNLMTSQVQSLYSKLIIANNLYADNAVFTKLRAGGDSGRLTTIGIIPNTPGITDPTKDNAAYNIDGKRMYYPNKRIMHYEGYVEGLTYKDETNSDVTLTGYAQVVFKNEEGSPIFAVFDGTASNKNFIYSGSPSIIYNEVSRYRRISTSFPQSYNASDFLDIMFTQHGGPTSPRYPSSSYFCGNYINTIYTGHLGVPNTAGTIYTRSEVGQPLKYVTALNGNTAVTNGWYYFGDILIQFISANESEIVFNLTMVLQYLTNGVVTKTVNMVSADTRIENGPGLGTCPVDTSIITFNENT